MKELIQTKRIATLKKKMMDEPRYVSIEEALIITKTYKENEDK
jgi:formate C-acetyltransferase